VGTDPSNNPKHQFVVCIQNHDQVGNRMLGDRLPKIVSIDKLKLAAGIMLISPFIPMLFMGEEYGEDQPFQYFVHHGDPDLVKAVQEGRKREFDSFKWQGEVPDPQSEKTFQDSTLNWDFHENNEKLVLLEYYQHLLKLRKEGAFDMFKSGKVKTEIIKDQNLLKIMGSGSGEKIVALMNFSSQNETISFSDQDPTWSKLIASSDMEWLGSEDLPKTLESDMEFSLPAHSISIYIS